MKNNKNENIYMLGHFMLANDFIIICNVRRAMLSTEGYLLAYKTWASKNLHRPVGCM